jgi:DNA-binding YbaB/EbfC family protein
MELNKMQQMMEQAAAMQQVMQQKLRAVQVESSVGGGAVVVRMNGEKVIQSVKIDKDAAADVEMLQDLILAAVNEAARKADAEAKNQLGGMLGNMGVPPGMF